MNSKNLEDLVEINRDMEKLVSRFIKLSTGENSISKTIPPNDFIEIENIRKIFSENIEIIKLNIVSLNNHISSIQHQMADLFGKQNKRWLVVHVPGSKWDGKTLEDTFSVHDYYSFYTFADERYKYLVEQENFKREHHKLGDTKRKRDFTYLIIQMNDNGAWEVIKRSDDEH